MHQQINTVYLNIDVEYRLVNGQLGTVMHIAKNHRNEAFNFFCLFILFYLILYFTLVKNYEVKPSN